MNIAEILRRRAVDCGELPAIIERGRAVSFVELDRIADSVASQLEAAGIRSGDRVLVFCPMSIALYGVLIGLWRVGGVAMFLDPSAGRDHIERCCRRVPPAAFLAVPRAHMLRLVSRALRRVPMSLSIGRWVPGARTLQIDERPKGRSHVESVEADKAALITFTSGSTGEPKAAVRSHGFLVAQHRVLADDLRLRRGQRDLSTLPIFVLANLASGVTSIIPDADLRRPGDVEPLPIFRQIRELQATRVAASPAFLERLGLHARSSSESIGELDEIYTGGAPVFPRLLRLLHAVAPHATVTAVYGSTEAEPIARIAWSEIESGDLQAMERGAGLLAGVPVAAIDLRVLPDRWGSAIGPYRPDEFERQAVPTGTTGEIVVAGDHVLRGYLDGVGDAETKFRVENRVWHRTGDAGYLDARGRVWLLGRCSAKLDDQYGRLYPFAVECAALTVDGVRRCALVEHGGARVLAVELEGIEPHAARPLLMSRLDWARIADILAVRRLPVDKRHNAKIDYPALRRMLARPR